MIEPGSQRERVHREATALIRAIRDRAARMIRDARGICVDCGLEYVDNGKGGIRCPNEECERGFASGSRR
jgi:hypothetical protein